MTDPKQASTQQTGGGAPDHATTEPAAAEALVEEVSIDGMCGVY